MDETPLHPDTTADRSARTDPAAPPDAGHGWWPSAGARTGADAPAGAWGTPAAGAASVPSPAAPAATDEVWGRPVPGVAAGASEPTREQQAYGTHAAEQAYGSQTSEPAYAGPATAAGAAGTVPPPPSEPPPAFRRHGGSRGPLGPRRRLAAGAAALVIVAGGVGGGIGALTSSGSKTVVASAATTTSSSNSTATTAAANGTVSAAAAKVLPSVVTLEVDAGNGSGDTGSGIVIRSDGYILTNAHVVSDAGQGGSVTVKFTSGRTLTGTVVGSSTSSDLAVVKVNATGLTAATFGDSSAMKVGDLVVAVGSPLGLSGTVTSGIVSALNRQVTTSADEVGGSGASYKAIQTDAAINPGNSGGALVDSNGNVIGITSSIASLSSSSFGGQESQSGSIGVGFAIPGNQALTIANQLISQA